jgi:hypothetical protein
MCFWETEETHVPSQQLYIAIYNHTLDRLKTVIRQINSKPGFGLRLGGRKDEVVLRLRDELDARRLRKDKEGYAVIREALLDQ